MNRWVRLTIGIPSAFAALCFVGIAFVLRHNPPGGPWPFIALAAFWAAVAVACLTRSYRRTAVRFIGGTVAIAYFAYALYTIGTPDFLLALQGLLVFGATGAYVAFHGIYPKWGRASEVFNPSAHLDENAARETTLDNASDQSRE
jgi:hypothetical protein